MTADDRADDLDSAPDGFDPNAGPVFWPALTSGEALLEWGSLRRWVEQVSARFPHALRVPPCWWQHNDLVELLSALRDCERDCFAPTAPASAAVDWHRAFRDLEARIDAWTKRFTCTLPGREHPHPSSEAGWVAFVASDTASRR